MSSIGMMQHPEVCIDMSIFDVLSDFSFRKLDESRKKFNILRDDYRNKNELVQLIGRSVQEKFSERLYKLDYERYSILKCISDGDDFWECDGRSIYSFIISDMAIECKLNDKSMFVLPDELFDVFREIDSPALAERSKQNSELYELINGCMMSYGLIHSTILKNIISKHISFKFDDDRFREAMNDCEAVQGIF